MRSAFIACNKTISAITPKKRPDSPVTSVFQPSVDGAVSWEGGKLSGMEGPSGLVLVQDRCLNRKLIVFLFLSGNTK